MESISNDFDFLSYVNDKDIRGLIKDETLMLSDKIIKINRYNMSQERNIIITNKAIYNLKKKSLKRRIDLLSIRGISISKITDEFVIHGNDQEYDYDYVSKHRKKIIEWIAKSYFELTKKEVSFCEIDDKSLKHVVTLKKEKKKDQTFSRMTTDAITSVFAYLYGNKDSLGHVKQRSGRSSTLLSNNKLYKEVTLEDFKVVKVIGRGSYGKVCLVEFKPTNELYAMKSLKKDILIDQDQIESTLLEKKILESIDHPLLVGLIFCFQTEDRLYFVMPFLRGGELFQHLRKFRIFDEEKVRFYAAQIGLGLEHLHYYGYIYRDLKPENILMDDEGYLKLADFGMAKQLKEKDEKAMSFCGTPEYLAPEIITGVGHDKAVDWWSFGILIYEMLCGIPPFYNENLDKMYDLIKNAELRFPKKIKISSDAQDIITKLLDRDPTTRMGTKRGLSEIREHPFFASIEFDLVLQKKINPPFKPEIESKTDVQNFDEEFTSEEIAQTPMEDNSLEYIRKNQEKFNAFK